MTRKTPDKTNKKTAQLIARTATTLRVSEEEAEQLLRVPRQQSIRLNPLHGDDPKDVLTELTELGWKGEQYSWCKEGYTVEAGLEAIRDSRLVKDGEVYIQNASSWLPVVALDPQPGERILDMCAAPGGKASHIAARTDNQAELFVNDNSRTRLAKMQSNFIRLNVTPAAISLRLAEQLYQRYEPESFDKILLDAPCSGEGLMDLANPKALQYWSVANIKRLSALQKRMITTAWQLLKPGGTLVYSTCTMAPEEDELVADYILRRHENVELKPIRINLPGRAPALLKLNERVFASSMEHCLRLKPTTNLEAFFVAKMHKLA